MRGIVTADREALVPIRVWGTHGRVFEIHAVVDTGFTEYLSLSSTWAESLALPVINTDRVTLANGDMVTLNLCEGEVEIDGHRRTVVIHIMEGIPVLGMSLMWDHLLMMHLVEDGAVAVTPIG